MIDSQKKTFFIETFGCQMNVSDSAEIRNAFLEEGFIEENINPDIVVINSCAIRHTAEDRAYSRLSHYGAKKRKKKENVILILTGCVAQKDKEKVFEKVPQVNLVIGTHEKYRFVDLVKQYIADTVEDTAQNRVFTEVKKPSSTRNKNSQSFTELGNYDFVPSIMTTKASFKSDITIIHGCNKMCTYCVVPFTRGEEISQKSDIIVDNVKKLIDQGVTEVCLLGQNVNSYGQDNDDISFSNLLRKINTLPGLRRIRFLTSHPIDFSFDLIYAINECEKVCKYIHLPLQSASNFVLSKMRRYYTYEKYMTIVNEIRKILPHAILSTDIIVGFPYENQEDFKKTEEAMKEICFDLAYMFKYSVREGTKAAQFEQLVPEAEKLERLQRIIEIQRNITERRNQTRLGSIEEVLLESLSKNDKSELIGKTDGNLPVVLKADKNRVGEYVKVELSSIRGNTFVGRAI